MNPSRIFILRPVATCLLMLALLLTGWISYRLLPVSALPQVDYPTIQVMALYPGASPEVMTSSVTAPLERQFGQMPGLNRMSSISSGGASVITLQFALAISLDVAEQQVQAAINTASNLLPQDLPMPPIYSKVNPADAPVLTLAVMSKTMPVPKMQELLDTRVVQKIAQLPGVGLVSMGGGLRPAVRIQVNPRALADAGLSMEDVRLVIASANVNIPKGSFDGSLRASTIDANDQLKSAAEYRNLIISFRSNAPIRLSDVAQVVDDAENVRLAAWANDSSAVLVNIQRQPGSNVIEVVDRLHKLLPELRASLPASVEITVLADRTDSICASVRDVQFELLLAVVLVVMVIFVFLRSPAATLIPSIAVPLSLVGTFGVMYLAGFSINNLTLMALTVASGFVVDDAIVMIENIARYIEQGEDPLAAALKGSRQIGFTILSLTFSLIAVLIPLLFMRDVVGRLFREFAITLAVAILLSALVSLTLTPMLCARLLKQQAEDRRGGGRWFRALNARYAASLRVVLRHQGLTLLVALATVVLTVALYIAVPKGFFPVQDTGIIQGISEATQSISFNAMAQRQQALARMVLQDPAVASIASYIGVDGNNATLNSGRMLINLKPKDKRDTDATGVIRRLQARVAEVEGIALYMQPVQDLTIEDQVSRTQFQMSISTANPDELRLWVPKVMERLTRLPQLADVATDQQERGLQAYVEIDRDSAGRLGVTLAAIDAALYNAFGQRLISTIFTQSNQYRVVLEVAPEFQRGIGALEHIHVTATGGGQIPLSSVARVTERPASLQINHLAQFPAATVSFNLAAGAALGPAVEAIRGELAQMGMPASVDVSFQGAALAFNASLANTLLLILAAIVTMYIVLGILYESAIHPVTILSTLPSAGVGALLALKLSGTDLSIVAVIGIILLIGIVKKNAIMMIDFALDAERNQGLPASEAIYQAALLRLRPILMTTFAALLGALPLMLGTGVGSELRHPLGLTMVGGLLVSQVLTLYTTPVIYLAFDRLARRARSAGTSHAA